MYGKYGYMENNNAAYIIIYTHYVTTFSYISLLSIFALRLFFCPNDLPPLSPVIMPPSTEFSHAECPHYSAFLVSTYPIQLF